MKKILVFAFVVVFGFVFASIASAATTVVYPGNEQGWGFLQETATGSGSFVVGPAGGLGVGSANLVVDSTGGVIIGKADYAGTKLADIDTLEYSTYRTSGGPALAIALQFNFDGNVTDENDAWQGRLVYEPYHTQTVTSGIWETWDAMDDSAGTGTGNWWGSPNAVSTLDETCPQSNPCTWAEVLAAFPDGGVHNTLGAVILKAGGGWTGGFDGNVDALTINDDIYDFEVIIRSTEITSPDEDSVHFGEVDFEAYLTDDDTDAIQWAVRGGTCAAGTGTVFGNVDAHSDVATINQSDLLNQTFSFTGDMSAMTPGMYCFIYNPVEDGGETNIRLTREFWIGYLTASPTGVVNPLNTEHTVTANIGVPVEGVELLFLVSGVNVTSGTETTDTAGEASFTYTGTNPGEDTITVCVDEDESGTCDEGEPTSGVTKNWIVRHFVTGGGNIKDNKKVEWTFAGTVGLTEALVPVGNFQIVDHDGKRSCHFSEFTSLDFSGNSAESPVADYDTAVFEASGICNNGDTPDILVTILDAEEPGSTDKIDVVGDYGLTFSGNPISGGNFQVHKEE